jgi:hypothetical protein
VPVILPAIAVGVLLALSLVARDWKYDMTSASLIVLAGVAAMWMGILLLLFG